MIPVDHLILSTNPGTNAFTDQFIIAGDNAQHVSCQVEKNTVKNKLKIRLYDIGFTLRNTHKA